MIKITFCENWWDYGTIASAARSELPCTEFVHSVAVIVSSTLEFSLKLGFNTDHHHHQARRFKRVTILIYGWLVYTWNVRASKSNRRPCLHHTQIKKNKNCRGKTLFFLNSWSVADGIFPAEYFCLCGGKWKSIKNIKMVWWFINVIKMLYSIIFIICKLLISLQIHEFF